MTTPGRPECESTPTAIDIGAHAITLRWDDGEASTVHASWLRQNCRCPDCRRLALQGNAIAAPASLSVTHATPIGNYGVQLHFSDGHERGVYPWSYLRELAQATQAMGDKGAR